MRLRLSLMLLLTLPAIAAAQTARRQKGTVGLRQALGRFHGGIRRRINPVVQRVLLSGRFHYDFAAIDSDQGNHDEWNVRRLRIGPRITLFRKFTFHCRGRARPTAPRPVLRALHRFVSEVDEEPPAGADRRQAERAVHARRSDFVTRAHHHRPKQPCQQHLVPPGISARRERVWQAGALGVPGGLVFGGRGEPRARRVQRRDCRPRRARLRFRADT